MNVGIICGSTSGAKPVVAAMFPRFFHSSGVSRSTSQPSHPYSHQSERGHLQDPSYGNNVRVESDAAIEETDVSASTTPENNEQGSSNWANVSSSIDPEVPRNSISVNKAMAIHRQSFGGNELPRILE